MEKILYTIQEVQDVLGIGRNLAYKLLHLRGFPSININGRYFVPKEKLETWVKANIGKHFEC